VAFFFTCEKYNKKIQNTSMSNCRLKQTMTERKLSRPYDHKTL